MYRLSLIISEIYNKYLPLAEKDGIILNLDFSDTTKEISNPDQIKSFLDEHLESTLKRSDRGEVTISVDKEAIIIADSATTLSHAACALLSNRFIDVTSRVGFGTTVRIFFKPRELPITPASEKPQLSLENASFAISANQNQGHPKVESQVQIKATEEGTKRKLGLGAQLKLQGKPKPQSSSSTNKIKSTKGVKKSKMTTKTAKKAKREISAAAKKADKQVKRIAKKAEKQTKKLAKVTKKAAKTTGRKIGKTAEKTKKTAKKTIRKLKLS